MKIFCCSFSKNYATEFRTRKRICLMIYVMGQPIFAMCGMVPQLGLRLVGNEGWCQRGVAGRLSLGRCWSGFWGISMG